ncbi:TauD/TfdA family dioxygenase [Paracoccus sp. MBLB3053]|uniref:TauD/TfdA family dioxygenase n=1 Tax=Paracoccus aurantius TaxID=3073814 RepID=A0ABU2HW81_9RHOB|nr:TauD/TfdA family dioxygenase [Paracoccus sp. MBLB3053]MDS9469313.1 TauD/TfdA family dioxygenase [Paracoccus sp. MBLB3053]
MNTVVAIEPSEVTLGEKGLSLPLNGEQAYFNYYWLRDNCLSSFDSQTRERTFDIFHLDGAPVPQSAAIEGDNLTVLWAGDGHISRYPLSFLSEFSSAKPRHDPADLPRRAWFADHYPNMARFSQAELKADPQKVAEWIKALIVDGVAIVSDMPDTDAALTETVELMGHVRPTFFGLYFDVRTHINPTNLAYTAKALELHTDTPAEEHAPGMQFLHMRANTVEGGRNLFLDGVAVANDFRDLYPEEFKLLAETPIPFYCEHDNYDMRSHQRVIELDQHGNVSGLTISQHMLDVSDLSQEFLDSYYPAFCRFGRMLQDDKYVMKFTLHAGECIVFDNHRIVHGRASYTAESGERYLRGCYSDRAEMRSTYRALVSEGRFK